MRIGELEARVRHERRREQARTRTTPRRTPQRGRIERWKLDNSTQDDDAAEVTVPIDLADDLSESRDRQRLHEHDGHDAIHERAPRGGAFGYAADELPAVC